MGGVQVVGKQTSGYTRQVCEDLARVHDGKCGY